MVTSQSQLESEIATTPHGWTPREIEARLPRGAKARIARRANCHYTAVTKVIRGKSKSRRLQGMIAQTVGVPADVLFPVRLDAHEGGLI
jgi:lambda repressor-like predicted transcriptional regulator